MWAKLAIVRQRHRLAKLRSSCHSYHRSSGHVNGAVLYLTVQANLDKTQGLDFRITGGITDDNSTWSVHQHRSDKADVQASRDLSSSTVFEVFNGGVDNNDMLGPLGDDKVVRRARSASGYQCAFRTVGLVYLATASTHKTLQLLFELSCAHVSSWVWRGMGI